MFLKSFSCVECNAWFLPTDDHLNCFYSLLSSCIMVRCALSLTVIAIICPLHHCCASFVQLSANIAFSRLIQSNLKTRSIVSIIEFNVPSWRGDVMTTLSFELKQNCYELRQHNKNHPGFICSLVDVFIQSALLLLYGCLHFWQMGPMGPRPVTLTVLAPY